MVERTVLTCTISYWSCCWSSARWTRACRFMAALDANLRDEGHAKIYSSLSGSTEETHCSFRTSQARVSRPRFTCWPNSGRHLRRMSSGCKFFSKKTGTVLFAQELKKTPKIPTHEFHIQLYILYIFISLYGSGKRALLGSNCLCECVAPEASFVQ